MIPLADIVSRVRTRHEQSSTTRWTDARIQQFINEGLETLAEATGFYERYVTIPVQENRSWYDLRGFTNETVVKIKAVWSTARTAWLEPVLEENLQFQWEDAEGDPEMFFTRGIYWLGVWPKAGSSTTGYMRVQFAGIPPRFTGVPSVLYGLPDEYVPALEDYALAEMSAVDKAPEKAVRLWEAYYRREKALSNRVDRRLVANTPAAMGRY